MAEGDLSKTARERLEKQRIDERYKTGRTFIRAAACVAVFWFISGAIGKLAGHNTTVFVDAALSVFADIKFAIAVTLAGGAAIWAILERRLRHRKVETMQGRIAALEKHIDPNRSSSMLTPKGQTNPTDRG